MEKGDIILKMGHIIMVSGFKIKWMVLEYYILSLDKYNMKVNGKKMFLKEKEYYIGKIVFGKNMKDNLKQGLWKGWGK